MQRVPKGSVTANGKEGLQRLTRKPKRRWSAWWRRIQPNTATTLRALRRLEYSWARSKRHLPEDPHYEERLEAVVETVATAGAETTVLVEDETELRCFPPLRKAWMPVGEQWSVEAPRQNLLFCLYGALDVRTGKTLLTPTLGESPNIRKRLCAGCSMRSKAACF